MFVKGAKLAQMVEHETLNVRVANVEIGCASSIAWSLTHNYKSKSCSIQWMYA